MITDGDGFWRYPPIHRAARVQHILTHGQGMSITVEHWRVVCLGICLTRPTISSVSLALDGLQSRIWLIFGCKD